MILARFLKLLRKGVAKRGDGFFAGVSRITHHSVAVIENTPKDLLLEGTKSLPRVFIRAPHKQLVGINPRELVYV